MDQALSPFGSATVGSFEAIVSLLSATLYLVVAFAAVAKAPRDVRVHLFLLIAITNLFPYVVPVLFWQRGQMAFTKVVILGMSLSITLGSLALLHFFQIFPWRRPWILEHGRWLAAGYFVCPVLVGGLILAMPDDLVDLTETGGLALLVVGLPATVLIGIVIPFAGILSLYKSWLTSKRYDVRSARSALLGMFIGQLGGGVLSILVIPLLHFVLPEGPWLSIASGSFLVFGLIMPIAFWAGVWRDGVLRLDPSAPPGPL
jgi:hypothetical protein